jgi:hypothetical protein
VLSLFWHARRGTASSRKRVINALHAGNASRQARNVRRLEPALAPPAGERVSTRSAPGDQTVPMHTARGALHGGGSEARQHGVCEPARDAAARGHKGGECGGIVRASRAQSGHGMGALVNGGARQSLLIQEADGVVSIASPVFEGGRWAAHDGKEASQQLGDGCTRPGRGHRHRARPHLLEAGSPWRALMVTGLKGEDGQHRARAQSDTDINQPEHAVGKRRLAQGGACEHAGRLGTDARESRHPVDERVRAWGFRDAQGQSEETEDTRDGAKADAGHSKQMQGQGEQVTLVSNGTFLTRGPSLTQASPGVFTRLLGVVALLFDPPQRRAQGTIVLGSLRRFVLPLLSALSHCGPWAPYALSCHNTPPPATGDHSGRCTLPTRSARSSA